MGSASLLALAGAPLLIARHAPRYADGRHRSHGLRRRNGAALPVLDDLSCPAAGAGQAPFQVLDHAAIYLLIAGTYTPFTLGVLQGAWGWTLFGVVWGLATCRYPD